jgi:hypothetical protein
MGWLKFLIAAVVVMAVSLGGLGGWLLPRLGVDPFVARIAAGALGGVLVVLLLARMRPGQAA